MQKRKFVTITRNW